MNHTFQHASYPLKYRTLGVKRQKPMARTKRSETNRRNRLALERRLGRAVTDEEFRPFLYGPVEDVF